MNQKIRKFTFAQFLEKFPSIELPVIISEDSHHVFSENNKPFPLQMIHQFLAPFEPNVEDELTEFVPCFSLPDTPELHVLVYWKASLMNYEYILTSFTRKGDLIDRKVIAGSMFHDGKMVRSVATIDEDWMIHVIGGVSTGEKNYDPTSSQKVEMELLPDGRILKDVKW